MSGSALSAVCEACAGFDRVGVAVSGGGDSVAALVLAVEALGAARVEAVTVDHGLRAEAAAEAAGVGALCSRLGVTHAVLRWEAGPAGGNLMGEARAARMALIGGWARRRVDAVLLGHTLDDQAETLLMRLARGSGVDGLSGMEARREAEGTVWLRPLLGVPREALREVLRARGVAWVEDPSNADPRFLRSRARRVLGALEEMGIGARGLVATAGRMRRARAVLEAEAQRAMDVLVREDRGLLRIDPAALGLPGETRDRLFAHLLMQLSGSAYRPRLEELHRLVEAGKGTLMGCHLRPQGDRLLLGREARAVAGLACEAGFEWDGRWRAGGAAEGAARATIRAMGEGGLAQLGAQARAGVHPHWRETGVPQALLAALPGLWRDGRLVAAPLAFWPQGWSLAARPLAAIVAGGT
ncbi:MAG: tRNA lysidine(34) synthetase TilS [Rhodobacteraceae bacterium]|nr:tRNA lysidine(34) synthetase TilS [Paracoccaceae bacterium]